MISTFESGVDKAAPVPPDKSDKPRASNTPDAGARRGRKPRCLIPTVLPGAGEQVLVLPSVIEIHRECFGGVIVLRLKGVLDTFTVIEARDAVFTVVGARPPEVCVDLHLVMLPLSPLAMETLLTMRRVANMVSVRFSVLVSPPLLLDWQAAGLSHLLPVQNDSRFLAPVIQ